MKGIFAAYERLLSHLKSFPSSTLFLVRRMRKKKEAFRVFRILLFAFLLLHGYRFQEIFRWFAFTSLSMSSHFPSLYYLLMTNSLFCFELLLEVVHVWVGVFLFRIDISRSWKKTFNHNNMRRIWLFVFKMNNCFSF